MYLFWLHYSEGLEKTAPFIQVNEYVTKYKAAFVQLFEMTALPEEVDSGKPPKYHSYGTHTFLFESVFIPPPPIIKK